MNNELADLRKLLAEMTPGPYTHSPLDWECDCPNECDEYDKCENPVVNCPASIQCGKGDIYSIDMGDYFGMNEKDAEAITALLNKAGKMLQLHAKYEDAKAETERYRLNWLTESDARIHAETRCDTCRDALLAAPYERAVWENQIYIDWYLGPRAEALK